MLFLYKFSRFEMIIRILLTISGLALLTADYFIQYSILFVKIFGIFLVLWSSFRMLFECLFGKLYLKFTTDLLIYKTKYYKRPSVINWVDVSKIVFQGYTLIIYCGNKCFKIKYSDKIYDDLRQLVKESSIINRFSVIY